MKSWASPRSAREYDMESTVRRFTASHDPERDVCLYINLMFLLGSNFDTDVQLPWLADILTGRTE